MASNRIAELRKLKGLTLSELAQDTGIPRANISRYEHGTTEPKIEVWETLADKFGVSVQYLQGLSDSSGSGVAYGDLLKTFRVGHGLTVEQVADSAGVDVSFLRDLEAGKLQAPNNGMNFMLAQAIGRNENETQVISFALSQYAHLSEDSVYSLLTEEDWSSIIVGLGQRMHAKRGLEQIKKYVQSHGDTGDRLIQAIGSLLASDTAESFDELAKLLASNGDQQANELGALKQVSKVFDAKKSAE